MTLENLILLAIAFENNRFDKNSDNSGKLSKLIFRPSQYFIQDFNKLAILFILILKMTKSSNFALKIIRADNNKIISKNGNYRLELILSLKYKIKRLKLSKIC